MADELTRKEFEALLTKAAQPLLKHTDLNSDNSLEPFSAQQRQKHGLRLI